MANINSTAERLNDIAAQLAGITGILRMVAANDQSNSDALYLMAEVTNRLNADLGQLAADAA